MAETYGIYDYKAYSPNYIGTLAVGLPESSRIHRKYSKCDLTTDQILLATIADSVNKLIWGLSGKRRGKEPKSILKLLLEGNHDDKKDDLMSFASPEEFEKWRAKKRKEIDNGRNNRNRVHTD